MGFHPPVQLDTRHLDRRTHLGQDHGRGHAHHCLRGRSAIDAQSARGACVTDEPGGNLRYPGGHAGFLARPGYRRLGLAHHSRRGRRGLRGNAGIIIPCRRLCEGLTRMAQIDDQPEILWSPAPDERCRLDDFGDQLVAAGLPEFNNYEEMWRWSVTEPNEFWLSVCRYFDIPADPPAGPTVALSTEAMPGGLWFPAIGVHQAEVVLHEP